MATITQPRPGWTFRRVVAELPFIPAISNWIKLLLSLLAEPLMFMSSLYIIAETVIPGASGWPAFLNNGTKTVMSLAPEIILPGCFQQAQIAGRNGSVAKSRLLYALCVTFGVLTLVTLASFIWNFSDVAGSTILFVRCGAGIGYTIILNISGQPEEASVHPVPLHGQPGQTPGQPVQDTRIEELMAQVTQLATSVSEVAALVQQAVTPTQLSIPVHAGMDTSYTDVQIVSMPVQGDIDSMYTAFQAFSMLSEIAPDGPVVAADTGERPVIGQPMNGAEVALEVATPHIRALPEVAGISAETVALVIAQHLDGVAWSKIAELTGKNYSRIIKPIRLAYEAQYKQEDRQDRQPEGETYTSDR